MEARLFQNMRRAGGAIALAGIVLAGVVYAGQADQDRDPRQHEIHDENRPKPEQVTPGDKPDAPPSDATVLFDGENLSEWQHGDGQDPKWEVKDGYVQVVPETGDIQTKESFGDVQLHLEFATDPDSPGEGQHRSNSGVFFMGIYELQVLDNHDNPTYADGYVGSAYGQYPPLVNASREEGEWQTYDVVFRRPRFDENGEVTQPATMTVFHNGVLVQDHSELIGPTSHAERAPYRQHADRAPLRLQDHQDDPIRFRNIWVRDLESDQ